MTKLTDTQIIYRNPTFLNFIENYTLGRTVACQERYEKIKKKWKLEYPSHEDKILDEKPFKNAKMWVTYNEFPYDLPTDFEHIIVWVDHGTQAEVKQLIFAMFPITKVVCISKNLRKDQSVKGIAHHHVFVTNDEWFTPPLDDDNTDLLNDSFEDECI